VVAEDRGLPAAEAGLAADDDGETNVARLPARMSNRRSEPRVPPMFLGLYQC
jgi:hypothetical protein